MKAPTYAYEIGAFTITRNGELEFNVTEATKDEIKTAVDAAKAAGFEVAEIDGESTETAPQEEGDNPPETAPEIEEGGDDGETAPQAEEGETGEDSEPQDDDEIGESVDGLSIVYPLEGFTPESIDNLHKMVASKAPLIKKALGIDELPIQQSETDIIFPWFEYDEDGTNINAYSQFITQLCKTAQAKTRVTASAPESFENEKFSMRVWMISLGMKGAEFATIRKLMMAKLDGNSGFRYEDKQPRNPRSGGTSEPKQVVSVRFTEDMLGKIAELASQSGMSRNSLIESVVAEYVQGELGAVETAPAPEGGEGEGEE